MSVLECSTCVHSVRFCTPCRKTEHQRRFPSHRWQSIVHHWHRCFDGGLQPWVALGSAKAAMESLVRYLAVALAQRGITMNAISPRWTENSALNSLPEQVQSLIRNWHAGGWTPMRRLGTPEDIGDVVSLFCSEQAGWITGQVIYTDGGASLMSPEVPPEIQLC